MTSFKRIVSQSGFDIEQRSAISNETPLISAAHIRSRLDMMSILLDKGANVDAYSRLRRTALQWLCWHTPSPQITALINRML